MANRFANLVGSKKISEDFNTINIGFDRVQQEMDAGDAIAANHIANANIHVTAAKKAEWDSKAPGSTATDLSTHKADQVAHVTQDDHDKLAGIEDGAQVNQPAFSKVNDLFASDPESQFYIVEGIGIRVTTNPNTGEIIITATGDAAPGAHGQTHTEYGADPIPTATLTEGGLLSATQLADIVAHGELLEEQATAITELEDRLDTADTDPVTLQPGLQIIRAERDARFRLSEIKGRTKINLMGVAGDCETITGWTSNGAIISLNTSNRMYGTSSLNVASNGAAAWGGSVFYQLSLDIAKYYVLLVDIKNKDATDGKIMIEAKGVNTYNGNNVNSSDKFAPSYITLKPTDMTNATGFVVHGLVRGSSGQSAYFDGFRVYEITAAEYTAISGMTAEQVAAKYPFVSSGIVGVDNPYAIGYGENLLPPFYEWEKSPSGGSPKIADPYTFETNDTDWFPIAYTLPCLPNAQYMFLTQIDNVGESNYSVRTLDSSKNIITRYDRQGSLETGVTIPLATEPNAAFISVLFGKSTGVSTKTVRFSKPVLTLGTELKPFKPREDTMIALQTELHANPNDGSDPDILFEREGQYFKLAKWRKLILDGTLNWTLHATASGLKQLKVIDISTNSIGGSKFVTKYNGRLLKNSIGAMSETDLIYNHPTDVPHNLYMTIANTDSGWGDSYTPTADEIKAYFNGWKMYVTGASRSEPYNGTGVKAWCKFSDVTNSNPGTQTLPTNSYDGFTPYNLLYRLAKETVEPVVSEGALRLNEGGNLIEVGTGIVLREGVVPRVSTTVARINNTDDTAAQPNSRLKFKAGEILQVYKHSQPDNWAIVSSSPAYGNDRANKDLADFDPSAIYSVTYIKLDKSPIQPITGSLAANEKAQISDLTAGVAEALQRVSVVEQKKAEKDAPPPAWLTPTLLNGWVLSSNGVFPAQYRKDPLTNVVQMGGIINGGTTGSVIFTLPPGYRPKTPQRITSCLVSGTSFNFACFDIAANGNVTVQFPGNVMHLTLNATFIAEQ